MAGLVYTLAVQQHELKLQHVELQLAREQTRQQTRIFRSENFERRFFQALDQFRSFQQNVSFVGRQSDIERCEIFGIPPKSAGAPALGDVNTGVEAAGTLARICCSRVLLEGASVNEIERKQLLVELVSFYGGVLTPLVKRVRGLLEQLEQRVCELEMELDEDELGGDEKTEREKSINAEVLMYVSLLQTELKPDQHALLSLCGLYDGPYEGTARLMERTHFLHDFNWRWGDILMKAQGGGYLDAVELSQDERDRLTKMGLKVIIQSTSLV
ncbi:hypothetical protein [Tropicibacter sp. Alg240-R139]|uniref:hypothetical protein n=1 Tax=Tropicibacter sp. Alg240-R139 TaxID=2305991 RepID=UPI0019687AA1|nr:hypothetical protein [Tropicibacter sp. Alg240-R139]